MLEALDWLERIDLPCLVQCFVDLIRYGLNDPCHDHNYKGGTTNTTWKQEVCLDHLQLYNLELSRRRLKELFLM
ncbi:hypothetical protein LguiA_025735 [Lonicera macranthoides]